MSTIKQTVARQNILRMKVQLDDPRLPQRFWDKVQVDGRTGCWMWTAGLSGGYGTFAPTDRHETRLAHLHCYRTLVGPVPMGLELDHLCRRCACVNPACTEPVTHKVNILRGKAATKHFCVNGHEYTKENTRWSEYKGSWGRHCLTCTHIRNTDPEHRALRLISNITPERHEAQNADARKRYASHPPTPSQLEAKKVYMHAYTAAHKVANREKPGRLVRNMTPAQREAKNAEKRAYIAANREKVNARQRISNMTPEQREAKNAYARDYRAAHPEKMRAYRLAG